MPSPHAPPIVLDDEKREQLEALARAHSTPQAFACRARIVLRAADEEAPCNLQIAVELGCSRDTVGLWRRRMVRSKRYAAQGLPLVVLHKSVREAVFPKCCPEGTSDNSPAIYRWERREISQSSPERTAEFSD